MALDSESAGWFLSFQSYAFASAFTEVWTPKHSEEICSNLILCRNP